MITLRREFAKGNPRASWHVGKGIFLPRRGAMNNPTAATKKEYEAAAGVFLEHDKPEEILPGVWLTGPAERSASRQGGELGGRRCS